MSRMCVFDRMRDIDLRKHLDGTVIPKGKSICEWCGSLQDTEDMLVGLDGKLYCIRVRDGISCYDKVLESSEEV